MYQPQHFVESRLEVKHDFVRAHPFGLLVSAVNGIPTANAVPFVLNTAEKPFGRLQAHLARSNSQWQDFKRAPDALVVFQGPHAYITPSWYQTKRETGKAVPTWNYAMVQVRGKVRVIEDRDWLLAHVTALTASQERKHANHPRSDIGQKLNKTDFGFSGLVSPGK